MKRKLLFLSVLLLIIFIAGCFSFQGMHTIQIKSDTPGLEFTFDGEIFTTPATITTTKGYHNIEVLKTDIDKDDALKGAEEELYFRNWLDGSYENPRKILIDSDKTIEVVTSGSYYVKVMTSPKGIVNIPGTGMYSKGEEVTLTAPPVDGYEFYLWNFSTLPYSKDNPVTFVVNGWVYVTALYKESSNPTLNINTSPVDGIDLYIDNEHYLSPKSIVVEKGSTHTVTVAETHELDISEFIEDLDTRYLFINWEDGVDELSRSLTVNENTSITANFDSFFKVEAVASPSGVIDFDESGWYKDGKELLCEAPEIEGYLFKEWTINNQPVSSDNNIQINVDSPKKLTAVYYEKTTSATLTINTLPYSKLKVLLNGEERITPETITVEPGTEVNVSVPENQEKNISDLIPENDTSYTFSHWNDGYENPDRMIRVISEETYSAVMDVAYKIVIETQPVNIDSLAGVEWINKGEVVELQAPQVDGYDFDYWLINEQDKLLQSNIELTVDEPKTIKAIYKVNEGINAPSNLRSYKYSSSYFIMYWDDNSSDEDGFEIWKKINGGPYKLHKITSSSKTFERIPEDDIYYFKVRAFRGKDYSDFSNEIDTTPFIPKGIPTNPSPADNETGIETSVTLQWELESNDENYTYDLYFGNNSSPEIHATDLTTMSFTLENLNTGTNYYWKVVAKTSDGANYESPLWTFATKDSSGKFKIANSWGVGGWENVPDGFYYMTYDAMIKNKVVAYIVEPKDNYEPKAMAVFKISHPNRGDNIITIGIGDPENPEKTKTFQKGCIFDGGSRPYPDNKMVLDITELLPIEDKTIFLKFTDGTGDSQTGTLEYFAVELYEDYQNSPIAVYRADGCPISSKNGESIYALTENVTFDNNFNNYMSLNSFDYNAENISDSTLDELISLVGISEGEESPDIVNGYGTGLIAPTLEEWNYIQKEMKIITGMYKTTDETLPSSYDHSLENYFPPIGSQGQEGSCTAWSIGYYVNTTYEARNRGWDLSEVNWTKGAPDKDYQSYIMSPDFAYHLVNNGDNSGSYFSDIMRVVSDIGISSWETMPYIDYITSTWPEELAWREAPLYRNAIGSKYYLVIDSVEDVRILKALIADGYLAGIAVDAYQYNNLSSEDVWNTENYKISRLNHANTIVGYYDNR
jgi:hypothetical protein